MNEFRKLAFSFAAKSSANIKHMKDKTEIDISVEDRDSQTHRVTVPTDMNLNLMEVMKGEGLDVKATCGGMALCSTCHVYVLTDHFLAEPSESEEDMLDQAFDVEDNSRLACQIRIAADLDGLIVKLAPEGF